MSNTKKSNTFTQGTDEGAQHDLPCYSSKMRSGNSQSIHSFKTHKSRFTNSSKLTQSKLFKAISKANLQEKNSELVEQRNTEIEILENSLEGVKNNEKNLLVQMGALLMQYANLAQEIQADINKELWNVSV